MSASEATHEASASPVAREAVFAPGRNCWRVARAGRVAFLVDASAYYSALADAIGRAERQIVLVGWDFNSHVRLRRDGSCPDAEDELVARLDAAARRARRLRVYVLGWDFALLYALERQLLPVLRFELPTHRRVAFRLAASRALGGSHHQKLAVIDDALAFVGGLDLTAARWDTPEHARGDPRRNDPGFPDFPPFHDVQMAVDGPVARCLGGLARRRWNAATGQVLPATPPGLDPWPPGLAPAVRDVDVAIARTRPGGPDGRRQPVREVEELHLDAIGAARRWIYIENQYLTARRVGEALADRLRSPDGPEIVLVLPRASSGWLEEATMGMLRAHLVARLREADRFGRLRIYAPRLPGEGDPLTVHAKVFLADGELLRIGSANLSNRSMGLDTECDLALEAGGRGDVAAAIAGLRDRLLGEHLGVAPERVAETLAGSGSLIRTVEALRGGERSLEPLEPDPPGWLEEALPDARLLDPERPIGFEELYARLRPGPVPPEATRAWLRVLVPVVGLALLAAAWRWSPLASWVQPDALASLAAQVPRGPLGLVLATLAVTAAASVMVPVMALIVGAALVLGWVEGAAVGLLGALLAAVLGYGLGQALWRDVIRRIAGRRLDALNRRLARNGVVSVAAVRLVPIAPFTLVNLVAGASRLRLRDFLIGTLLGMGPGAFLLAFAADRVRAAAVEPGAGTIALAVGVVAGAAAVLFGIQALVARRERDSTGEAA